MAAVAVAAGAFRAAFPMSGHGDFLHMHAEQELRHITLLACEFGPLSGNEAGCRRCSPIFAVDRATTPRFVLHGSGHSPRSTAGKVLALGLERAHETFTYRTYPDQTCSVASPANVRQMPLDTEEFFRLSLDLAPATEPHSDHPPTAVGAEHHAARRRRVTATLG